MKTPLFFLAALGAFFALPFDFTMMLSALFGAGLMAITISDYRRTHRPIPVAAAAMTRSSAQRLQLAA